MDFLEELNRASASGRAFAVCVLTAAEGAAPRHAGAKMIVFEDGTASGTVGGGAVEQHVTADALECLRSRKTLLKTWPVIQSDGIQSGSMTVYIEPSFPRSRLVLCGAGHVAGKLVPLAKTLGFRVTVIDIRDESMVRERAGSADELLIVPSWAEGLARVPEGPDTYLIACAFNFEQDEEILYRLVQRESAYVGMLASAYKRQTIYGHLRSRGISAEQLEKVHSPIGLQIGAETPEEIAVSIAAELVRARAEAQPERR